VLKSPFPGMDPFLESKWAEVHARLIVYASNQINSQLPGDLQANIEDYLAVYHEDVSVQLIRPDLSIEEEAHSGISEVMASSVAVAEPLVLKRPPHPDRHLEIVSSTGRVITAIEFLSPWNKVGNKAREQYARKQCDYLEAGINLVEIDLIRQGGHVLAAPLEDIPEELRTAYLICISRSYRPDRYEVYRASLTEPLPNIPIPLRPKERDVVLQLQVLIDDCYRDGRYHRISYQSEPKPKFSPEEATWIDQRLRDEGRRS
jgi:hypothetical protein